MSALDELTSQPFTPAGGGVPTAISKLNSTPPPPNAPGLSTLTSQPFKAPATTPTASPYFQGKESSGAFLGISDETDPYSGRPYFAYRLPGDTSTTTDMTRTAPKVNPEIAAPTPRDSFTNPRMPESASQDVRKVEGATADQQLDHRMALAVGGSNNAANLKLIPTAQNQAAGANEGTLSSDVAAGKISLFDAQRQEAQAKGLPVPFTDQEIKDHTATDPSWWSKLLAGGASAEKAVVSIANSVPDGFKRLQFYFTGGPKPDLTKGLDYSKASTGADPSSITENAGNAAVDQLKKLQAQGVALSDDQIQKIQQAAGGKVDLSPPLTVKYPFSADQGTFMPNNLGGQTVKGIVEFPETFVHTLQEGFNALQGKTTAADQGQFPISGPEEDFNALHDQIIQQGGSENYADWTATIGALGAGILDLTPLDGILKGSVARLAAAATPTTEEQLAAHALLGSPATLDEAATAQRQALRLIGQGPGSNQEAASMVNSAYQTLKRTGIPNQALMQRGARFAQQLIQPLKFSDLSEILKGNPPSGFQWAGPDRMLPGTRSLEPRPRIFGHEVSLGMSTEPVERVGGTPEEVPGSLKNEAPVVEGDKRPAETAPTTVFRASDQPYSPDKVGSVGAFVSPSEDIAKTFSEGGTRIVEKLQISPEAKVLEWKDVPQEFKNYDGKNIEKMQTDLANYARSKGFDVINNEPKPGYLGGIEHQVVNPKVLVKATPPTAVTPTKEPVKTVAQSMEKPERRSGTSKDFADLLEKTRDRGISLTSFLHKANDVYDAHHAETRDRLVEVYKKIFERKTPVTDAEIAQAVHIFQVQSDAAAARRTQMEIHNRAQRVKGQPQNYLRDVIQRRAQRADVRQTINPEGLPQGRADIGTQINGMAEAYNGDIAKGPFKGWSTEAKDWFQNFVFERRNTPLSARVSLQEFQKAIGEKEYNELLDAGIQGMHDYDGIPLKEDGRVVYKNGEQQFQVPPKRDGGYGKLAELYKHLYDEEVAAGIPVREKQHYEPIYLANKDQPNTGVPGRRIGLRPKFIQSREYDSYLEAMDHGNTPAFQNVVENLQQRLLAHYHAMADAHMFNNGIQSGYILPESSIDPHKLSEEFPGGVLRTYDPDRFPKKQAAYGNTVVTRGFMGPEPFVKTMNNYLHDPDSALEKVLQGIADFARSGRSFALGIGIPKTAFTVHYWNMLRRDASIGGLAGLRNQLWWGARPGLAAQYINDHLQEALPLYQHGLVFSTEDMGKRELGESSSPEDSWWSKMINKAPTKFREISDWWHKQFSGNFYGSYLPARQMQAGLALAKKYKVQGMSDEAAYTRAAQEVNDFYGILDSEALARSKGLQNFFRVLLLAPQLFEDNIRMMGKMGKGIAGDFKSGPNQYRAYANYAYLLATLYAIGNVVNYERTGKLMEANDPIHAGDIDTGFTDTSGREIYIPLFGSGDDLARIPMQIYSAIAQGKTQDLEAIVRDRLSTVMGPAVSVVANVDWSGSPLYGKDNYGRPIPGWQATTNLFNNVVGANLPGQIDPLVNFATGQESGLQFGANEIGAPLAFKKPSDYYDAIDAAVASKAQGQQSMAPIYDQVQKLAVQGDTAGAQKILDGLTDAQYKEYTKYKAAQKSKQTAATEKSLFATYQQIQQLVKQGKTAEAQQMVNGMSDADYKAYTLLKSKLAGQ